MSSDPRPVVMDSDVTIALLKSGTIGILGSLKRFTFMITEVVAGEITKEPERSTLFSEISRRRIQVTPLTDPNALGVFSQLLRVIDPGEASAIALAESIGGDVAMHDKAGRRAAAGRLSEDRVHRLDDIVVEAIRECVLSIRDADEAIRRLQSVEDYQPAFAVNGFEPAVSDPTFGLGRAQKKSKEDMR